MDYLVGRVVLEKLCLICCPGDLVWRKSYAIEVHARRNRKPSSLSATGFDRGLELD